MWDTHRFSTVVKATSGSEVCNDHAGFRRATGIGQPSSNERPSFGVVSDAVAGQHEIRRRLRHINAGERFKMFPKVVVAFGVRSARPECYTTTSQIRSARTLFSSAKNR